MAIKQAGPSVTLEEMMRRTTAIVPALQANAARTERLRKVAPQSLKKVIDAGIIRSTVPPKYGGYGLDRDAAMEMVIEVSRGCGSTGWCTSIWLAHSWRLLYFPAEFQDEFFADGPDVLATDTAINNWQKVEAVAGGGYRVSGQWSFGSGCDYSAWCVLAAELPEGAGWICVPRADFKIVDNWQVFGMSGTGSKDVLLEDAVVPAHRAVLRTAIDSAPWHGYEMHRLPSLCVPSSILFTQGLTAPLIGIGQALIDEFVRRLLGRTGPGRTAESVPNQMRVAESQIATDTARVMILSEVKEIIAKGQEGYEFRERDRIRYRARHTFAAELCVRAVQRLFEATGGRAIYNTDPMQRLYRDVMAVAHHGANTWDPAAEQYGRQLLGLPPSAGVGRGAIPPPAAQT